RRPGDGRAWPRRGPTEGGQIAGKRRHFVGNEEIAFAREQKQNAYEQIAFPREQKQNAHEQIPFAHEQKQNAYEQIAFPHEQKQNAREQIAFPHEQKQNAREEIAFPDCGRGAKEVLLPPSLECTSGIRFNRPNWQNCCIRHRRRGVRSFVYVPIPGLGSGSSTAWAAELRQKWERRIWPGWRSLIC